MGSLSHSIEMRLCIVELIKQLETPFLQTVWEVCGTTKWPFDCTQRGWRACGTAGTALAHLISERLGVSIGRSSLSSHGLWLEVVQGFFDPRYSNDPIWQAKEPLDHVHLRLRDSKGRVLLYIDPVYNLLWGDWQSVEPDDFTGAIKIIEYNFYSEEEVDDDLTWEYLISFARYRLGHICFALDDVRDRYIGALHERYIAAVNSGRLEDCVSMELWLGETVIEVIRRVNARVGERLSA
jgi:hypothetical protein